MSVRCVMSEDYVVDYTYENDRTYTIEKRCVALGIHLIDNPKTSIRKLGEEFGVSKSQVHRDLHKLRNLNDFLYIQCMNILKRHKKGRF